MKNLLKMELIFFKKFIQKRPDLHVVHPCLHKTIVTAAIQPNLFSFSIKGPEKM